MPLWRALRDVFNRYECDITPYYLKIEGQLSDLNFRQPTASPLEISA